jgi:uncharacterized protein
MGRFGEQFFGLVSNLAIAYNSHENKQEHWRQENMKPTQILRLSFVSLILVMAISVNQSANGKTPDFNDILKSAQQGDPNAQVYLGLMYSTGDGVTQDYKEALKWLTKAAEQGIAAAQFNVGLIYTNGYGVPQDYREAIKWFRKAAEQGYAEAQNSLGVFYYKGLGVDQDYKQSVYWTRKAAEQGSAMAQNNLGTRYYHGQGIEQDYKQAIYWFRKSAEQGVVEAQHYFGICLEKGQGIEQDYKQAVYWYLKAAEQGYANAQTSIGACYCNGKGVEKDYKKAMYWFHKADEQDDAESQFNIGLCYYNGQGVEKNYEQAVYWFSKAAERGNADAQCNLGTCYASGQGVAKDYKKAVYWCRKAAEQGITTAQYNLSCAYYYEQGVTVDYVEAYKWLVLAEKNGKDVSKLKILLQDKLRLDEIKEAQKLAKEFNPNSCGYLENLAEGRDNYATKDFSSLKSWIIGLVAFLGGILATFLIIIVARKSSGKSNNFPEALQPDVQPNATSSSSQIGPVRNQHKVKPSFFSFGGRLNRAKYFWTMFAIGLVLNIMIVIWPSSTNTIIILSPVAVFFPVIKRLHDINKSGGFAFLMFVPPLNLILGIVLLFMKGTIGPNQYGDDPLL